MRSLTAQRFRDRAQAGKALATEVAKHVRDEQVLVLALPRGGVPVAKEVAQRLNAALDVLIVRKLGVPWQPELAMGAIAGNGEPYIDELVVSALGIAHTQIDAIIQRERAEIIRRERLYRSGRAPLQLHGKVVVLVDDGIATGATMQAAIYAVAAQQPSQIIVAAPVAQVEVYAQLASMPEVSKCICIHTPEVFEAVGLWYDDFRQISDEEVEHLLSK